MLNLMTFSQIIRPQTMKIMSENNDSNNRIYQRKKDDFFFIFLLFKSGESKTNEWCEPV